MDQLVILCSAGVAERHREAITSIAPRADVVTLAAGQRVADDDVQRITVAFSSDDLYPATTPALMRVCLDAPRLLWLQTFSAGVDHPVFAMIRERGVQLTTASGAAAIPIAHHVILGLLALARDLPGFLADQRDHAWRPRQIGEVEGRTVGVVGMGPIGLEVARLATALGMRPIGMRRSVRGDEPCPTWTFDRLDDLLQIVDDLVLALPLTDETRNIIGAHQLDLLRVGARFVNVGRGDLVDEAALVERLTDGRLDGAVLDVFATEPLPAEHPLWSLPNVILTPHSSGESERAFARVEEIFLDNLQRFVAGHGLHNLVV